MGTVPFDPGTEGPHSLRIPVETVSDTLRCWGAPQQLQVRSPRSFPDSQPHFSLLSLDWTNTAVFPAALPQVPPFTVLCCGWFGDLESRAAFCECS